jgi:O-antigen/teichoic acid export membrane protein
MWTPYQLQLAHGWTALAVKVNVIAVIVLIPAILWIVPAQGAIGAAWVWVALNAGYLVVTVLFMHRRLLPTEKWRWYGCDVAAPLLAATLMAALCRWVVPDETGKIVEFVVLLMSSGCVLLAAAMAAPMIGHQLMKSAAGAFRLIHARLRTRNLGK